MKRENRKRLGRVGSMYLTQGRFTDLRSSWAVVLIRRPVIENLAHLACTESASRSSLPSILMYYEQFRFFAKKKSSSDFTIIACHDIVSASNLKHLKTRKAHKLCWQIFQPENANPLNICVHLKLL